MFYFPKATFFSKGLSKVNIAIGEYIIVLCVKILVHNGLKTLSNTTIVSFLRVFRTMVIACNKQVSLSETVCAQNVNSFLSFCYLSFPTPLAY